MLWTSMQGPSSRRSEPLGGCLSMSPVVSRRTFLQNISVGAAAVPLAGGILLAQAGRKVRHASFGASGMALSDIRAFSSHGAFDLVAVADVDLSRAEPVKKLFPNVRVYQDWRELLRQGGRQPRLRQRLDAGSHARADRHGGDVARQARLRAEAAGDHGPRDPHAGGRGTREDAWCRRWASRSRRIRRSWPPS